MTLVLLFRAITWLNKISTLPKLIFNTQIFCHSLEVPLKNPQNVLPPNQFFERLNLGRQFLFDISTYLRDKYFGIVWGYSPSRNPQTDPQNQFFEWLNLGY